MSLPLLTVGIEEEYQIIDPATRELHRSNVEFLELGRQRLGEQVKPEFRQCQIEVGTQVCRSLSEARMELSRLRRGIVEVADDLGLQVAAASTHPFSSWEKQVTTAGERYTKLEADMGDLARQMLIFGMHVHVGIDDPEMRVDVMNQARYFMPHALALSTSSPYWHGRDTGLKSYRSIIFEDLPRTGLPPSFDSWDDYQGFLRTLIRTNCIDEPTKIWWDCRCHPLYPTIEFRITDMCTKVDEAICLASLLVGIVGLLLKLRLSNRSWRNYRHHLITENKWRAVRHGIDGKLIDFGRNTEVPFRFLALELLDMLDEVVDELGIRDEVAYVHTILDRGTSADRQRRTFERTGDLTAVVDRIVAETREGL